MNKYIVGLALLLTAPVLADDYETIVEQAFSDISGNFHQEWAFTETVTEEDITVVGRYDPRLPEESRWNLISVDNRQPTEDEIAEYQEDKEDEFDDDEDGGDTDFVNLDTLALIEETESHWLFSFIPDGDNDEDEEAREFMKEVKGTLKIVRDGHYPVYVDLQNDKPIRPVIGAKISRFKTHLTFGPADGDGPIVPFSIDVEVKGRAMLVISFDEQESIHYGEYEYVGP